MNTGAEPELLPLFPLRTVLFPGGELPLRIFEQRYIELVRNSIRLGQGFGIPPIRHGNEAGTPVTPYSLGTLAHITDWNQGSDGLLGIVVEGSKRFEIIDTRVATSGLLMAQVRWLPDAEPSAVPAAFQYLAEILQSLFQLVPPPKNKAAARLGASVTLAYRLAERLPLSVEQCVEILGMSSPERQLAFCEAQIERLVKRTPTDLH